MFGSYFMVLFLIYEYYHSSSIHDFPFYLEPVMGLSLSLLSVIRLTTEDLYNSVYSGEEHVKCGRVYFEMSTTTFYK